MGRAGLEVLRAALPADDGASAELGHLTEAGPLDDPDFWIHASVGLTNIARILLERVAEVTGQSVDDHLAVLGKGFSAT